MADSEQVTQQKENCRLQIKLLLSETDELVKIPDHGKLAQIKAYREKLRGFSATDEFPDLEKLPNIDWS